MATWNSRGLRGSGLEDLINRTNESYREKGLALIQKVPTPINVTVSPEAKASLIESTTALTAAVESLIVKPDFLATLSTN